jgi:hypothetical protein
MAWLQHLDELVDLPPLARHRRHQALLRVGDAQLGQEGRVQRQRVALGAVVGGGGLLGSARSAVIESRSVSVRRAEPRRNGIGGGDLADAQAPLPLAAHHQLDVVPAGDQVRVVEALRHQPRHLGHRRLQRQVLGDVLGPMPPDHRQVVHPAQQHSPRQQLLQRRLGIVRPTQHQPLEAAVGQALAQPGEELLRVGERRLGGGWRIHRAIVRAEMALASSHGRPFRWGVLLTCNICPQPCSLAPRKFGTTAPSSKS